LARIKSGIKRHKQSLKARARNRHVRSTVKPPSRTFGRNRLRENGESLRTRFLVEGLPSTRHARDGHGFAKKVRALFPLSSAISVRTSLTAVFTVERTWRLRALAFRLCLCRLMPDLILANLCLLAIVSVNSVNRY